MISNVLTCEEVEELDWFHPNLKRHHAEAILIQNGKDGSYLLRSSTSHCGEYSLSVRSLNSVKHFQIGWDGKNYIFGMGKFPNLKDFIQHFENKPLIGGESGVLTLLKYPYPCDIEEPDKYETVRVHAEWGNNNDENDDNEDEGTTVAINSKEGYLTKQGARVKNWKARWFVLHRNELKYYRTQGDDLPIKTLDIDKCLCVEDDDETGKPHAFKIQMPNRIFYIYAKSDKEKKDWMDILNWRMEHKGVKRNSKAV